MHSSCKETSNETLPSQEEITIHGTGDVLGWLCKTNISLAFSSYELGKLFMFGRESSGGLSVFHRNFDLCMGLAVVGNHTIYVGTLYQIWKLSNILPKGELFQDFDRLYSPRSSIIMGELDTHDITVAHDGRLDASVY